MNQIFKIIISIVLISLNILFYVQHSNSMLHFLQLLIELSALSFFSYSIIKSDFSTKLKLIICALLIVIFKNISLVISKYVAQYYPVFNDNYGDFLLIGILVTYAIIIYFGIEQQEKKNNISDFTL